MFANPAYALGDYPLYQITVTATTGVAYTKDVRGSDVPHGHGPVAEDQRRR